jgi:hypothetical protein
MAEADPADVRLEIDTDLENSTIQSVIDRKSRDIDRDDGIPSMDPQDRADLEALLATIHIATRLDRAEDSVDAGPASVEYEESMIDELRADARKLGATDELLGIGATDKTASITVPSTRD